jgi:hypothetical protein
MLRNVYAAAAMLAWSESMIRAQPRLGNANFQTPRLPIVSQRLTRALMVRLVKAPTVLRSWKERVGFIGY